MPTSNLVKNLGISKFVKEDTCLYLVKGFREVEIYTVYTIILSQWDSSWVRVDLMAPDPCWPSGRSFMLVQVVNKSMSHHSFKNFDEMGCKGHRPIVLWN